MPFLLQLPSHRRPREIAISSLGVQTDPWEPDLSIALAQEQGLDYKRNVVDSKSIPLKDPSKDGVDIEDVWVQVEGTCQPNPDPNLVVKRSGWKTVRIFVSSTFKDFHYEREVLVKEV